MPGHIFISYSKKDSSLVMKLAADLQNAGFRIWIDRAISGGEQWRQTIEENLKSAGEVIIVISPNSMASDWVQHEGSLAYGWGIPILPVLIENVPSLPPWLEEYQYVDFTSQPYNQALKRLLGDLSPPNPVQELLDQQVLKYRQTGELIGETSLDMVIQARESLTISDEAERILQESLQAVEAKRQEETRRESALREEQTRREQAEKREQEARSRNRNRILALIGLFVMLVVFTILSISPYFTDWRRFNPSPGSTVQGSNLLVRMNTSRPDEVFVSDRTPGGFYKFIGDESCWEPISQDLIAGMQVESIAASDEWVYLITSGGLFVSKDAGKSWARSEISSFDPESQTLTVITTNPTNPLQAYVGISAFELFVTENGGVDWEPVSLEDVVGNELRAIASNGKDLILATEKSIWLREGNQSGWRELIADFSPVNDLFMVGEQGHFYIAMGQAGLVEGDVSSGTWQRMVNPPPGEVINSVSASNEARYVTNESGVLYWRLWPWTHINWWYSHLNIPILCY